MSCINDVCPITLSPLCNLPSDEVFMHADVGFEMVVLYEYLVTAPRFLNPLNRVAFTLEDLERLEAQMKRVFGNDCILHKEDVEIEQDEEEDENDENDENENDENDENDEDDEDDEDENDDENNENDEDDYLGFDADLFNESELVSRLSTSIVETSPGESARIIRLRVDIDVADIVTRSLTPPLDMIVEEEEGEEECSIDALPPRRVFESVVDMYKDAGRGTRMEEQLSLLQYLEYDAMNILVQIIDMADDQNFHRYVWQHTSLDVMDTVTSYLSGGDGDREDDVMTRITEPSPSSTTDYDLQVEYTSCWEMYRLLVVDNLQSRYLAVAGDILEVSMSDFRALLTAHRAHVRRCARENGVNYDTILEMLVRVSRLRARDG